MIKIANNNKNELPINENIRVAEMMVIGPNGEQMGIKNITDGIKKEINNSRKKKK